MPLLAVAQRLPSISDVDGLEAWAEALREAPGVARVYVDPSSARVEVTLDPPIPAATVVQAWAVDRPFAVSGDVLQRSWSLVRYVSELEDPHQPRIATAFLLFGPWVVDARLADRPKGPLPSVVAGASPAYDLSSTAATITSLVVRRAQ